jgi:hypothetical protein
VKLYELWPTTLQMVIDLKKYGTLGPRNAVRNNGKTTALLIYAQELVDTLPPGATVMVACKPTRFYQDMHRRLFPQTVNAPVFSSAAPLDRRKLHLLVDEPLLLKWEQHEWDVLGRSARVISVGPWL